MKKTNLIRVTLLTVVMAFMGAIGLSAQTSCLPSSQALAAIETELGVLNAASKQVGITPGNTLMAADQKRVGQNQSTNAIVLHNLKIAILNEVAAEIKGNGSTTDAAVAAVNARFQQMPGFDARQSNGIYNAAYQYVLTLLSC